MIVLDVAAVVVVLVLLVGFGCWVADFWVSAKGGELGDSQAAGVSRGTRESPGEASTGRYRTLS